jgi:uncharacterized integral membrane protein
MNAMAKHDDIEGTGSSKVSRRQDARLVAIGMAAVLLGWFALANLGGVTINFWVHDSHAPLILVILISGLLGALIATLSLRRRLPRE